MNIIALRSIYRDTTAILRAERDKAFPFGSVVITTQHGNQFGIVIKHGECPPDKLPILFENGNVWFKEFEEWTVVKSRALMPTWVKRWKRKMKVTT